MIVESQMSKNPTDLYNVMSFISLFSAMLPASFYLQTCGKSQIKTVVTNSDTQITSHFSSHFVSNSPTVDTLCAIKKVSRKWFPSICWARGHMIKGEISKSQYWQTAAMRFPLPHLPKKSCVFPSNYILFLFTWKQHRVPLSPN